MREIGRQEAGESRGSLILFMRIMEDAFQMEKEECKDQERLKMYRRSMPERGICFSMGCLFVVTPPLPRNGGTT